MAIVFRAVRAGVPVAVKIARGTSRARLAREAAALRQIGPPATPEFVMQGTTGAGHPFFVMELLQGQTLARWMAARPGGGGAPVAEVAPIVSAIAAALERVHAAGLVHRDVKPENVFLSADGHATLIDFGLSRAFSATPPPQALELTRAGQKLGTATYMSPEQAVEAREVDGRGDVYSLGVIAYELLTGRPPFVGDAVSVMRAHMTTAPPPPTVLVPLPVNLEAAVMRALAKDRELRFPDARSFAAAMQLSRRFVTGARRRSVELLGVAGELVPSRIAQIVGPWGGTIARVVGDRVIVAFPHGGRSAGVAALRKMGAHLIEHDAEVSIRESPRGVVVTGPAIERPSWLDGSD
jgi:serine/threonine protein kinase